MPLAPRILRSSFLSSLGVTSDDSGHHVSARCGRPLWAPKCRACSKGSPDVGLAGLNVRTYSDPLVFLRKKLKDSTEPVKPSDRLYGLSPSIAPAFHGTSSGWTEHDSCRGHPRQPSQRPSSSAQCGSSAAPFLDVGSRPRVTRTEVLDKAWTVGSKHGTTNSDPRWQSGVRRGCSWAEALQEGPQDVHR